MDILCQAFEMAVMPDPSRASAHADTQSANTTCTDNEEIVVFSTSLPAEYTEEIGDQSSDTCHIVEEVVSSQGKEESPPSEQFEPEMKIEIIDDAYDYVVVEEGRNEDHDFFPVGSSNGSENVEKVVSKTVQAVLEDTEWEIKTEPLDDNPQMMAITENSGCEGQGGNLSEEDNIDDTDVQEQGDGALLVEHLPNTVSSVAVESSAGTFIPVARKSTTLNSKSVLRCKVCRLMTRDRKSFLEHMRMHSSESKSTILNSKRALRCKICRMLTMDRISFAEHMRTHCDEGSSASLNTKRALRCKICHIMTVDRKSFVEHMRTHDGKSSTAILNTKRALRCKICHMMTIDRNSFAEHMRTHSGEKPRRMATTDRKSFAEHPSSHSGEKPYVCSICSKGFANATNLKCHEEAHKKLDKLRFECFLCGKIFYSRSSLDEHMMIHREENILLICPTEEEDEVDLEEHVEKTENLFDDESSDETYMPMARKSTTRNSRRGRAGKTNSHARRMKTNVEEDRHYLCSVCNKGFSKPINLKRHEETHSADRRTYGCSLCDKIFYTRYGLDEHMLKHGEEDALFKCEECQRGFTSTGALKRHVRTHTGEKPYRCELCERCFALRTSLYIHLRTHTGEKPYKCPHCERRFTQSSSLCVHVRKHSGDRPYICELCNKGFFSSSNLRNHERKHLPPNEAYQCLICDKICLNKQHLDQHHKTHSLSK